jgi:ABC-2 type transport system permease protein
MHPSIFMLEKEWIEHKIVTRVPLFILACGFLFFISLMLNTNLSANLSYQMEFSGDASNFNLKFADNINQFVGFAVGLLSIVLSSLYLPKTLRKERQEGSAMFWRSMPVSYELTHGVKLVFGLIAIPLICSILVLSANLLLWVLNMVTDSQLAQVAGQQSLISVIENWFGFIARMLVVGLALLPLACLALAASQLFSSPILIMTIAGYAVKWLSIGVFGFYGISDFFGAVLMIPFNTLMAPELFASFSDAGVVNLIIYYVLGLFALGVSILLSRTN